MLKTYRIDIENIGSDEMPLWRATVPDLQVPCRKKFYDVSYDSKAPIQSSGYSEEHAIAKVETEALRHIADLIELRKMSATNLSMAFITPNIENKMRKREENTRAIMVIGGGAIASLLTARVISQKPGPLVEWGSGTSYFPALWGPVAHSAEGITNLEFLIQIPVIFVGTLIIAALIIGMLLWLALELLSPWIGRVPGQRTTRYQVEFDREENGYWIAKVPALPNVMCRDASQEGALAKVETEALRHIANLIELCKMSATNLNIAFTLSLLKRTAAAKRAA